MNERAQMCLADLVNEVRLAKEGEAADVLRRAAYQLRMDRCADLDELVADLVNEVESAKKEEAADALLRAAAELRSRRVAPASASSTDRPAGLAMIQRAPPRLLMTDETFAHSLPEASTPASTSSSSTSTPADQEVVTRLHNEQRLGFAGPGMRGAVDVVVGQSRASVSGDVVRLARLVVDRPQGFLVLPIVGVDPDQGPAGYLFADTIAARYPIVLKGDVIDAASVSPADRAVKPRATPTDPRPIEAGQCRANEAGDVVVVESTSPQIRMTTVVGRAAMPASDATTVSKTYWIVLAGLVQRKTILDPSQRLLAGHVQADASVARERDALRAMVNHLLQHSVASAVAQFHVVKRLEASEISAETAAYLLGMSQVDIRAMQDKTAPTAALSVLNEVFSQPERFDGIVWDLLRLLYQ